MKKVIGVITARMSSNRLPGKVMQVVSGKTIFAHHVERMNKIKGISGVFLATSRDPLNEKLINEARSLGCGWYAGEEQDIVDRHIKLCGQENADAVIRVTCDCPIFDFDSASRFIDEFNLNGWDFICVSNMTMIQGTLSELISFEALKRVHEQYRGAAISLPIRENPDKFRIAKIPIEQDLCRPEYRLTVDEAADLELIRRIYEALYKEGNPLDLKQVYAWLDDNPQIAKINRHVVLKGCNVRNANLADEPVFSIVRSGKGYVIYDEHKRVIEAGDFIQMFKKLFSDAK